ncbi:MAG: hypothetical protein RLZZ81_1076 [Pseudomonadota bacterium]
MNIKNISLIAQEIFSTIDGNLESIISLFPLQYKKQYDAISYVINNLNNIRIQPQESQSLINELEEELTEITELTNIFKELKKLTETELLQICAETAELIKNNTLEEINKKIEYFTKISESELEKEYQTKITETQHKAVERKEQSKEDHEKALLFSELLFSEATNTDLLKVYENNLKDQERIKTAEDKKALEEYLEKKYVLLLNAKNSEEEKQEIIAEYKKEVEGLNNENRQNLQSQEHDQRTGKEITNIEEHKLVKAGILTQEEIAPYLSYYELLNTLGEYSSITENDNEETSLVKKLFDAARNFYENNPAQGLQELMDIPYQKSSDLLKENILQMLKNRQISFIDVNYIEASELDRINNIEIKPHYKLFECIIASGCPLTLQKLINDNKIDKFKKEELDLVVALLKKDTEALSKNPIIKLNNEIGKLLLTPHENLAYDLKELIPFIHIQDLGNEVFTMAALCQEIDIMKKIEQETLTSKIIFNAFIYGIYHSNLEIINYLLSLEKTNINEKGTDDNTLLHHAIYSNKPEIVELLLKHGNIDINVKNFQGHTPLTLTISIVGGNPTIVELLLKYQSINVNEKDSNGYTPLHQAINFNKPEIAELLINHSKVNVNEKDQYGDTPLHQAINSNKPEIVKLLLKHESIDVNEKNSNAYTPLHQAINSNKPEIAELLINHSKVNVHEKDQYGNTPLHQAINSNKPEIVKLLLKHESIDVNEKDAIGNTTLYQAVTHNRFEIVKILIEHPKINVNETNLYGNTPLHQANSYNYFSIVELLLKHKDINIYKKNLHNSTPLDLATNKPEILKLLNDYKESHEISMVFQDQEQEVQTLGEEYSCDTFDGA